MTTLLVGALLLSLVHAAIPNHWLPLVAVGKAQQWARAETAAVTAVAGLAHTLSTVLVGILVGLAGLKLHQSYRVFSAVVAPTIIIVLGLLYIALEYTRRGIHAHEHLESVTNQQGGIRSKAAIVTSLAAAMFFSPCLELDAYYLTAAALGWIGIALVSVVYVVVTVAGMVGLVQLGMMGVERVHWHFLDHHPRLVSGLVLVVLGAGSFFIKF